MNAWLERLSTLERKRRGFHEIAAEGLMGLSELKERLAELDEEREAAEEALEALKLKRSRLEALEQDAETLLTSYANMVPERMDALSPEERQHVYKMMHLKVYTYAGGGTELDGIFSLKNGFYGENGSSRPDAGPARSEPPRFCTSKVGRIWLLLPLSAGTQTPRLVPESEGGTGGPGRDRRPDAAGQGGGGKRRGVAPALGAARRDVSSLRELPATHGARDPGRRAQSRERRTGRKERSIM